MKPDWKDAPEWAKWLAMDEDGSWYWYEKEPYSGDGEWYGAGGQLSHVGQTISWEDSLTKRPDYL